MRYVIPYSGYKNSDPRQIKRFITPVPVINATASNAVLKPINQTGHNPL